MFALDRFQGEIPSVDHIASLTENRLRALAGGSRALNYAEARMIRTLAYRLAEKTRAAVEFAGRFNLSQRQALDALQRQMKLQQGQFVVTAPETGWGFSSSLDYFGEWRDGRPHGFGRETQAGGGQYEGRFVKGRRQGEGTLKTPLYDYTGDFVAGFAEGYGERVAHAESRTSFRGQWRNGLPDGFGEETTLAGTRTLGVFANGEPEGFALVNGQDGSFAGEWSGGQKSGWGVLVREPDTEPVQAVAGEWSSGAPRGEAVVWRRDGTVDFGQAEGSAILDSGASLRRDGGYYGAINTPGAKVLRLGSDLQSGRLTATGFEATAEPVSSAEAGAVLEPAWTDAQRTVEAGFAAARRRTDTLQAWEVKDAVYARPDLLPAHRSLARAYLAAAGRGLERGLAGPAPKPDELIAGQAHLYSALEVLRVAQGIGATTAELNHGRHDADTHRLVTQEADLARLGPAAIADLALQVHFSGQPDAHAAAFRAFAEEWPGFVAADAGAREAKIARLLRDTFIDSTGLAQDITPFAGGMKIYRALHQLANPAWTVTGPELAAWTGWVPAGRSVQPPWQQAATVFACLSGPEGPRCTPAEARVVLHAVLRLDLLAAFETEPELRQRGPAGALDFLQKLFFRGATFAGKAGTWDRLANLNQFITEHDTTGLSVEKRLRLLELQTKLCTLGKQFVAAEVSTSLLNLSATILQLPVVDLPDFSADAQRSLLQRLSPVVKTAWMMMRYERIKSRDDFYLEAARALIENSTLDEEAKDRALAILEPLR